MPIGNSLCAASWCRRWRVDPRLRVPDFEKLRASNAVIINIDYPLGMAAYYLLSRLGQGVGELRGVEQARKAVAADAGVATCEHPPGQFDFKPVESGGALGDLTEELADLVVRQTGGAVRMLNQVVERDFWWCGHAVQHSSLTFIDPIAFYSCCEQ